MYHHDYDGNIIEKVDYSVTPDDVVFHDEAKKIQIIGNTDGMKECEELGLDFDIFRDMIPDDAKEGDMIEYRIAYGDHDRVYDYYDDEEELHDYLQEKYGISLTTMHKEIPLYFEEDPIEDCDPFEGMTISFDSMELDGVQCAYYVTNLDDCDGALKAYDHHCTLRYEAIYPDGKDEDSLTEGDVIKFVVTYSPDDSDEKYVGEEAKAKIEEYQWYRLNLTRTEYEVTIDLSNSGNNDEV